MSDNRPTASATIHNVSDTHPDVESTEGQPSESAAAATTGPITAERRAVSGAATLVIEGDVIPRRLRRPADLMRLFGVVAATAFVFAGAYFASSTATGFDQDVSQVSRQIPQLLVVLANLIGGLGIIALPIATGIDLLVRRRGRQYLEALGVLLVGIVIVSLLAVWVQHSGNSRLLLALNGRPTSSDVAPLAALIAGTVAFITVARLVDRTRWAIASGAIVVAMFLASIVAGGITIAALTISTLLGWALGLLARYVLGTPTTRPAGTQVAAALDRGGFPLTVLRASAETAGGRRYSATTRSGERMEILVLDRDLEGAGLVRAAWRSLRLREEGGSAGFSMRSRLEHAALQSYASQAAGAPVPRLEAVAEVGPDAALLAYARVEGMTFAEIGGTLTNDDLDSAWRAVRTLHEAGISHRALTAENILRDPSGGIWLMDPEEGSVAAGDVAERLDLAELLCTLAMLTDPDQAVASGRRVLGNDRIIKALPALQPVALTAVTRRAIKRRKDILVTLRENLEELTPDGSPDTIQIERLRPRTIITLILGTVAAYYLLIQVGSIDVATLFSDAKWWLAAIALVLSAATYIGAAMSLEGFVPERLKFFRTFQAQLAASFATLVSPPTLGAVAVNVRYLQKAGVHPALALASVGVSQLMAFVMHLLLILVFGVIAGRSSKLDIPTIPDWAVVIGFGLVLLVIVLLLLPASRQWVIKKVLPIFRQVGPRLLTLAQQPLKLLTGISGIVLLNLGYCFCLIACVRAFGGGGEWAAICIAYLVGATVGQAAPTPGGLGAVEAALTAALAAAGVEAAVAVSAVLLFRIFTFWLPTLPGWLFFNRMTKNGYL